MAPPFTLQATSTSCQTIHAFELYTFALAGIALAGIALAGIALAGNSINTITNGSNIVYKQRHK